MTAPFDMAATMDALAVASGMSTHYAYPADDIVAPAFIVALPTEIDFHQTFGVGNAKVTFPCWIVVSKVDPLTTRNELSAAILTVQAGLDAADLVVSVKMGKPTPVYVGKVLYQGCQLDVEVWS